MNEHDIASAILSRVDCPFCHGRLYTDHKADCPVLVRQQRRKEELALMLRVPVSDPGERWPPPGVTPNPGHDGANARPVSDPGEDGKEKA